MPRFPQVSATTSTLSTRVFSQLAVKAQARRAEGKVVHALSVGDTYHEPHITARAEAQRTEDHPGLHQYAPVRGIPPLLDAVAERLAIVGRAVLRDQIQIMSGATSGLSVVCNALFDPGDEVLLPAPFWPLIRGIIASRGAVPVQIPFFDRLGDLDVEAVLEAAVTERTVALYINTPHNPTGRVLSEDTIAAMVRVARKHKLWILTDEAYQDLHFGERPAPVWARDDVQDCYVACHTLSKSYGIAGARIGYTHGAPEAMKAIRGVQTFSTYCAPKPMQWGAVRALREGDPWLAARRAEYQRAGAEVAAAFEIEPPAGGTFVLVNAERYFRDGETDAMPFLDRCLDRGVLLTPGASCGEAYGSWVRVCFTSVPPAELTAALNAIRPLLG
ncbi:MAG: pyridoxal phosphate-dependent aminotransferase [Myxococcota bacterium]